MCESNRPARVRFYLGVVLLSVPGLLAPILAVDRPALVDYPNHLARPHILRTIDNDPHFPQRYEAVRESYPNLAMDFLLLYPLRVLDIHSAGKLAVALAVALFAADCLRPCRTSQGRAHWRALEACFEVPNSQFP